MNETIELFKSIGGLNPAVNEIPINCMVRSNAYSLDCLYKTICPQFKQYFIKVGLIIIASYISIMFLKYLFFRHFYKYIPNKYIKHIGNIHELDTRIYWDTFINARLSKLMLGYIAVVVYLSLKSYS